MATRDSNHSIDRFLLVTVLGWYYRECYLLIGKKEDYLQWKKGWGPAEEKYWEDKLIVSTAMVCRAMNVCLREADGALLRRNPEQDRGAKPQVIQGGPEAEMYKKLKTLMQLQFSGEEEQQALRNLMEENKKKAAERKTRKKAVVVNGKKRYSDGDEVGIQRGTVRKLVQELITLEKRLQALPDQDLADWLAARVQGFRLRQEPKNEDIYYIAPVGLPEQQMAAVQAAYYPFLDKANTQKVLDLLGLTSERHQALEDISDGDEKAEVPAGGAENSLTAQMNLALAAVETVWEEYADQEKKDLFWYELTYHSWKYKNGELALVRREHPVPILPWQVVYSNGYFYLSGLRLDLPPDVTGGDLRKEPVFSNLRLDRIKDLHRVEASESDVDYTLKELGDLVQKMYQSGYRAPMTYRDESTIMYSGTPESLVIDCDPDLMNNVVDDFGRNNIEKADLLKDGRVRIRVRGAVWGGARQWLLQHAERCSLAPVPEQAEHRRELAETLRKAAEAYGS